MLKITSQILVLQGRSSYITFGNASLQPIQQEMVTSTLESVTWINGTVNIVYSMPFQHSNLRRGWKLRWNWPISTKGMKIKWKDYVLTDDIFTVN